jgi:protein-L-isoaspartate(D-aspartate) O-methyltransferase
LFGGAETQRRTVLLVAAVVLAVAAGSADSFAAAREAMVRTQIEARGVENAAVLRVLRETPRHLFMPEKVRTQAYADHPVPIGYGQTISQPYIVALMTELAEPGAGQKVLEIGTGSGYQAAVLSRLVKHVYSIEIVPELARSAAATLKQLGYTNVTVRCGDGYAGWSEQAPFDRIVLTAAPPKIPEALVAQLKPGGRLVAPEGAPGRTQQLVVIEKGLGGAVSRRAVLPVMFVPMVPGH